MRKRGRFERDKKGEREWRDPLPQVKRKERRRPGSQGGWSSLQGRAAPAPHPPDQPCPEGLQRRPGLVFLGNFLGSQAPTGRGPRPGPAPPVRAQAGGSWRPRLYLPGCLRGFCSLWRRPVVSLLESFPEGLSCLGWVGRRLREGEALWVLHWLGSLPCPVPSTLP